MCLYIGGGIKCLPREGCVGAALNYTLREGGRKREVVHVVHRELCGASPGLESLHHCALPPFFISLFLPHVVKIHYYTFASAADD